MRRIRTTAEVMAVIHASHPDLLVAGSFSDPDGNFPYGFHGNARMDTLYAFPGEIEPSFEVRSTWQCDESGKALTERKHDYFFVLPEQEKS